MRRSKFNVLFMRACAFDVDKSPRGNLGPQPTIDGERLYRSGNGTVHPKDSMPVHIRLRE